MKYFSRKWNDDRGDRHANWGQSVWWFETEDDGTVLRQIEVYETGPIKMYSAEHPEDADGRLSEAPLDLAEFSSFGTTREKFEETWRNGSHNN